jgi:hypothetical protein
MSEILNLGELIKNNSEIFEIDNQVRNYEEQIKNQDKYFDWQKPNVEVAQKNINELLKKREVKAKVVLENIKTVVNNLYSNFGEQYFVYYSNDDRFIQIHRNKCDGYKIWTNGNDLKFEECKNFKKSIKIANSKIEEVRTDIDYSCRKCQPSWNLTALKKALLEF